MKRRRLARLICPRCKKSVAVAMTGVLVVDGVEIDVCAGCWHKAPERK